MKKYNVTVNGNKYEVEIELVDETNSVAPAEEKKEAEEKEEPKVASGDKSFNAPMPGNIVAVNVSAGQSVKKGDVLFILEAMKMENEITATEDAVVSSVLVKKGDAVETGKPLCIFG